MSKKLFLTLVLILGMSSLSFGKTYLCIEDLYKIFTFYPGEWNQTKFGKSAGQKFILKTYEGSEGIKSFTQLQL